MNGIELFERIQQGSTFDELLQSVNGKTKAETQSKRGNVFERYGILSLNLDFIPSYQMIFTTIMKEILILVN